MRRTLTVAACLLAAALALSACGEMKTRINPVASRAQSLTLALDERAGAAQAGIFAARADGALARAGIDLRLISATSSEQALSDAETGRADVAVASEPELMLARNRRQKVTGFGAITHGPQATIVSINRRRHRAIDSVRALRGARLGVSGLASEATLLGVMLRRAAVPSSRVRRVNVSSNPVAALLSGRVDAYYGEDAPTVAAALRARHKRVEVVPAGRLGLPRYDGLVLATRVFYYAPHTNLLRRFVQALGRGYEAVRRDPAAGLSALRAARPGLDPAVSRAVLTATLPQMFPGPGRPWGWQDPGQWRAFGRFLTAQQVISTPSAWAGAGPNDLLAGQGP
ncbi:MAG TPA: ABC transporter substrate-binding protein [Solirubrobacteraceae bacterium]|nr:ABC transporter substrate-binding protein [Solirubrobacteraceae bacterium]